MLEQALAMSMDTRPDPTGSAGAGLASVDFSSMSEEQQIEYALQMSMQEHGTGSTVHYIINQTIECIN